MTAFNNGTMGADLGMTLFFLLLIFKSTGERGIVEFFQRFRRLSNEPGFRNPDHPAMDLLSSVTIDTANVDVFGVMAFAKVALTPRQAVENAYSNAAMLYPLYALVPPADLKQIQGQLELRNPVDLVSCGQLDVTRLTGSVTFFFSSTDFHKIVGKNFLLRDGRGAARVIKVTDLKVVVNNLPIGVYALQWPSVAEGTWQGTVHHLVVKTGNNTLNCESIERYASALADQKVTLEGLYGAFCILAVDVSLQRIMIDVISGAPHSYFAGRRYAEVTIKSDAGDVVFNRQILGDKAELFHQEVAVLPGYSIEIFHEEPTRMSVTNSAVSTVLNPQNTLNVLKLTAQGLVNAALDSDAGKNLLAAIDTAAILFARSPHLVLHDGFPLKEEMKRAINTFAAPVRDELLQRYRTLEFAPAPVNAVMAGKLMITWAFEGNGGVQVGFMKFDMVRERILLTVNEVIPHHYFSSTYMSVVLKSADGGIRYLREFRGDAVAKAESVEFPMVIGDTVSVMHREPSRSRLEADVNGRWRTAAHIQHATYHRFGGLSLTSFWPTNLEEV
jgi:hypothetical protein